jgi:hypothetical protein
MLLTTENLDIMVGMQFGSDLTKDFLAGHDFSCAG